MSKKTFFRRVAISAIVALGFGTLSVAPSQATVSNLAVSVANGTSTLSASAFRSDSTTAATASVTALFDSLNDSATVHFVTKSVPAGSAATARLYFNETTTPTGVTVVETVTAVTDLRTASTVQAATPYLSANDSWTGVTAGGTAGNIFRIRNLHTGTTTGYVGAKFMLQLDSTTTRIAGTYTYTIITKTYNANGAAGVESVTDTKDVSIVIAASAATIALTGATAIDPSKTTAVLNAGDLATTDTWSTTDSSVSVVATASATNHASIRVRTYTAASNPAPESVTVTVTGPGLVGFGGVYGKSITIIGTGGDSVFKIQADGTAGVASIVVKTTTVTFPAKNVTFFAKAAKTITLTVNKPVISVGTNTDVIRAVATDADGNVWGGTAYILADTAADALIAGSNATPVACTFNATQGRHECPVSGVAKGTAKLEVIDAATVALATATSATASVRVSTGVATTATISFDKTEYAPGEKAQLRVSILDAEGLALPATTVNNAFAADLVTSRGFTSGFPTASTNITLQGATSAALDTNAGHQTWVVYMPSTEGAITVSGTGGAGLALSGRVAVSGTARVVDNSNKPAIDAANAASDAALEAIDAANAATDAANLAAEAADAATVAAEEARDAADAATAAVEALATEVATLIAGLKAQITTLANTVAKIAKKVKA